MSEISLHDIKKSLDELNEKISMTKQEVFNAREAATYLRMGYDTILRLTRIGQIEYVPNGASYLYKKEYLDRWLDKNKKIG